MKTTFLLINTLILAIGNCGGPLIMRLYFIRGGKRIWFSSWLETGGWPIILIPLLVAYTRRRIAGPGAQLVLMRPRLFAAAAGIGILTGLDDYLFAFGVSKLPVSTFALIVATQLAFTAAFAFVLVKQKFTAYSINAVVLLTVGAVVLGLHTDGDKPKGETTKDYLMGFFLTLLASLLYGFILPVVELTYKKAKQALTYTLVLEIQLVMCFFATAFCTVGMIVNNDFQAIAREAKEYALGETQYYVVVVFSAIIWQGFFLGAIGVIFYSSSLLSGIIITVLLPVTEVLAVIFYKESFQAEKGVSLFLSIWGFISYFFGEMKQNKLKNNNLSTTNDQTVETQLTNIQTSNATATRFFLKPHVSAAGAALGVLIGVDNYLYSYGVNKLPVSTSALIVATQLVFTSTFSFLIVKQKFTAYTVNAVVVLTVAAVVLGLRSNGDRPEGESRAEYLSGFFMTVGAAALYGFILPLVQLTYMKAKQTLSYTVVLQMQLLMCLFATGFCTVAMLINGDFQAIPREAKEDELGKTKYYLLLAFSLILWQCFFLGVIGVIFYASSLLSGIITTVTIPITQLLAVLIYHERFQAAKGVSLFLSLWGFTSYFFGELKKSRSKKSISDEDRPAIQLDSTRPQP